MQYLVKFRWSFNPMNTALFDTEKEAISFARLLKENYGERDNFYCQVLEIDIYKPISY